MSDKKAQLEISANSAPAEKAFEAIQHSSRRMGEQVAKDGEKAGKAIDGIADGAAPAAQQLDTATKSMIASVQRTTAALQAGERGSAKYFETLAQQRGVDVATLQPYIDELKRVEAAQTKAGISAKQTAAALRGVPAQFTDIATSLAGGQAPLTVFLQQGGQLKDMFGGAGNAAKALGGYVVSLVNPFTVAAAAAGAVAVAYHQGSKEADAFRAALVTTGNAAGTSTNQLTAMANTMGQGFGVTAGKAAEVLAQLAATGQVGRASLQDFGNTAIQAEKAFGTATKDIAKNFADLGKDPVGASARLNESMNYLTASTYKQIQAAMDLGQESKAAALAQDAYNSAMKGRNAEMLASMGQIEKAWGGIKSAAKEAWDNMLGVGRPETVSSKLSKTERILKDTLERQEQFGKGSFLAGLLDSEVAQLKEKIAGYTEIERLQKRAGDSAAERVAKENAGIQAQKDGLKYLSDEQKMRNDIAQQTAVMRKAGLDEAAIQERIGQIKASYDKKINGGGGQSEVAALRAKTAEAERYLDALQAQGLQADKLNDGERTALKLREELKGTMTAQARAAKEAALVEADRLGDVQRRIDLEKSEAELIKKSAEENMKAWEAQAKRTNTLAAEVEKQREHNANIGLTKEAVANLTAARLEDAAATAEQNAQTQDLISPAIAAELRAQAKLYRELATLKKEGASKEAATEAEKIATKAAEKAAADWQRAAERIESSITDALMRGFESGKSFAQVLKDTVVNMFKTLVLRPQVQGIVSGTMGALGLGAPGQAAAGGLGDLAGMGMNALGLGGAGAMFGSGVMSGLSAWGAGGSVTGLLGSGGALFSGGLASGLGTIAGALGPIALGIGALYTLSKKLDTSGTIHTGGSASYSADAGVQKNIGQARTGFAYIDQRAETADMAASMTQSIVGLLDMTAKSFGKTAGYSAATAFADDTSKDGAWGSLIISKGGQDLLNWADNRQSKWAPKTFGDGEEGVKQYMAAVAKDVRDMLMQETPGWADAMLTGMGDSVTLDQLATVVAQINQIQSTFVQFGVAMPQLANLSDAAVGSLLGLAGGIQNLQSGLSAYYDKFYSDAEKQAAATQRMTTEMSALGLAMPATNAEYRKLVEAQDLTTEAGRRQYAALIALAPAFDQVSAAAAQATQRISQERERLELELLRAQGNTDELRNRERNALDASNRGLYDQIKALEDARAAQERYSQALSAAQSALATALDRVQSAQSAVDAVRERGTSAYLAALSEVASIQEQIADQARQTAATYRDLAKQLREYVTGIVTPPSSSFAQALTKALSGDREAMASLPGLATSASDQARNAAGSREEFAQAQARILSGVLQAAAEAQRLGIETPAQAAQTLQQKLLAAQQKLAEATATANAIGAPLVAQQERLIDEYTKALAALATANSEAALARAQLAAIATNTGNTATHTANTAANTSATGALTDELKKLGTVISVGGLVKFDPNDPIRSVFDNISKTNNMLTAQFVKWLEINSGSIVTQNNEAGTISVSGITGFMTSTNRGAGAAGFPGQYVLQYDATNYLMQIATHTATTAAILNNLAFGQYSMLVRGFGPGQSVPVAFKRETTSAEFFATGGAFTNGIVTRPTAFNLGVMGEKTPEAIMPLANIGGSLGIRAQMPGTQDMLQALQTMQALMQRLQTVGETTALTSQDMLNLWRRMTRDGRAMPVAPSVNDPLTVKVTA